MLRVNGAQIRKIRTQLKMTHSELAEKLKMAPSYLLQIERGDRRPSLTALDRIADVLGVDPVSLIEGATPFESDAILNQVVDVMLNDGPIVLHVGDNKFPVPDHIQRTVVSMVMASHLKK